MSPSVWIRLKLCTIAPWPPNDVRRILKSKIGNKCIPDSATFQVSSMDRVLFVKVLLAMFDLEVSTQDFARALSTWKLLEALDVDEQKMAIIQNAVINIFTLKGDDRAYAVSGKIGESSSWYYHLLKNSFKIDVVNGKVAEIKLRCDKKYVFFRYDPDIQYRISDKYGFCGIELVGDPGTTFSLVQSRT